MNGFNMKKLIGTMSLFLGSISVIVITAFAFGFPVSWLWNLFCPKVFGLPTIDWVDGTVCYILSKLLFNGLSYSSN